MNVLLEEERGAGVPEVVEGYLGQPCTLQERREGPLTEVGGVDEAAALTREYEALILVEATDRGLTSLDPERSSTCRWWSGLKGETR